jgi:glycerol uptake facilitator-like aquaporin
MARRLTAEFVGTAFLLATIVGSGIAGDRLSDSTGLALAINAIAVGAVLVALILAFGPASGGHFNPVVSLAQAALGGMRWSEVPPYVAAQCVGGILGAVAGNLMFEEPALAISDTDRLSAGLVFAEVVATFGLLAVIFGCARARRPATSVAFAVGAYITAAFFFTASTSFANPAVTLGRVFTDTFAGIDPQSAVAFAPAQLVGAALGAGLLWYLYPDMPETAERATIPRDELREEPDLAASTRAR